MVFVSSASEWERLLGPQASQRRPLLLQWTPLARQSAVSGWISCHPGLCEPDTRTQHARHLPCSYRLCPRGLVPPHLHPRATEILVVLEGEIFVAFITSNPNNMLISKELHEGDMFVFPQGLVHFQQNIGNRSAVTLSGLSSQNPGVALVANAVFGSTPPISAGVLAKAFQTDRATAANIQAKF